MRIDMDVETSEVPVKSIGRKPFGKKLQVYIGAISTYTFSRSKSNASQSWRTRR